MQLHYHLSPKEINLINLALNQEISFLENQLSNPLLKSIHYYLGKKLEHCKKIRDKWQKVVKWSSEGNRIYITKEGKI